MVTIRYNRDGLELEAEGHADYAERGKDIVCSACSILMYACVSALETNVERCMMANGYFRVKAGKGTERSQAILDTAFRGFELLEQRHPENVKIERE